MIEQFKVPNVSFLNPGKIGILQAGLPVLPIVALLSFCKGDRRVFGFAQDLTNNPPKGVMFCRIFELAAGSLIAWS